MPFQPTPNPLLIVNLKPLVLVAALFPLGLAAQDVTPPAAPEPAAEEIPDGFIAQENDRSRACVVILRDLNDLNLQLQPFGLRVERLRAILNSIVLEEREVMEELNKDDPLEAAIHAWFVADGQLANRFVETKDNSLQQQRSVAREGIKNRTNAAIAAQQTGAQAVLDASGDLPEKAQDCDGAILIRPIVLEVCATESGLVCDAAAASESRGIRFVDSAEDLWDIRELRPWTQPGSVRIGPNGQLAGGQSAAFARHGNVVLTVSFTPLIRQRASLAPEDVERFQAILDSIGFTFDHPTLMYAPSLAIGATLPQPLAGEDMYVLHFGTGEDLDVIWTAPAATGAPIEGPAILEPSQIVRLQRGDPLQLTAVKTSSEGEGDAVYTLEITTVNQAAATGQLLAYMAQQLATDLAALTGR